MVFSVPRTPGREASFTGYRSREGRGLQDFAIWAVLSEHYGPRFRDWPAELQDPRSPEVAAFAVEHARRGRLLVLAAMAAGRATGLGPAGRGLRAGMALGVMHDLAVGVSPHGADAWGAAGHATPRGITVGAPPDPYNQNGQDWSQPPWRPDRLAEPPRTRRSGRWSRPSCGTPAASGSTTSSGCSGCGGSREGAGPTEGTYVRYDHEAMIGILALEAHRAGALVVGEDLGTVEPWVRGYLSERGILGTSILWFEFEFDGDGAPLSPERWREYCLASVTTHDLPPTAGYLAGDHVRLRDELGILTRPLDEELAADEAERQAWLDKLRALGALREHAERGGNGAGPAPLPHLDAVAPALRRADRCGRGPQGAEPAGHDR